MHTSPQASFSGQADENRFSEILLSGNDSAHATGPVPIEQGALLTALAPCLPHQRGRVRPEGYRCTAQRQAPNQLVSTPGFIPAG